MDEETKTVIRELTARVETLERCVSALLPEEQDPLEANHQVFMAGAVAEARAREAYERNA